MKEPVKQVPLEKAVNEKLEEMSAKRREEGNPVWNKKAIIAELVISQYKKEVKK